MITDLKSYSNNEKSSVAKEEYWIICIIWIIKLQVIV